MSNGRYQNVPIAHSQDVFILGAGFSRAISDSMPLMRELNSRLADRLGPDYVGISSAFDDNFELAMTFLAQGHPWLKESDRLRNKALFLDASQAIAGEIEASTGKVLGHLFPDWLVRFVHYLHDQRCTVVTLNYDTLLERAFQMIELGQDPRGKPQHYLDPRALFPIAFEATGLGFHTPLTAVVLKLHGSTNWLYSGRSEYFGEPLRYRHLSGWSSDDLITSGPELAGRLPLIVPPVADKLGYFQNEAVQYLWSHASAALKKCRTAHARLFLVGYSLPSTDLTIRFLLGSGTQGEEIELVPVNSVTDINSQISNLFPKRYQINGAYQGDRAVERMVEGLLCEEMSVIPSIGKRGGGPVEERLRATLATNRSFPVPGRSDCFSIDAFHDAGMTIASGQAGVRTFVRWDCLEDLVPMLLRMTSPRRIFGNHDPDYHGEPRSVDDCLASWFTRSVAPWLAGLLEAAGILRVEERLYHTEFTMLS